MIFPQELFIFLKEKIMLETQVKEIIMHHLSSFQANDMDEVMSDYTDDSKLITPTQVLSGKTEIRNFLTELSTHFPVGQSKINLENLVVDHKLAYIVWNAKTPTIEVSLASDTFIIEEGKIHQQTFIGQIQECLN